jgi:uncharacterized membrane protein YfcA
MINARIVLLIVLAAMSVLFAVRWIGAGAARPRDANGWPASRAPGLAYVAVGFITNFFDTLGIGSFATTTTAYKVLRLVPDEQIPGTMIVGHALPATAQALIFIAVVKVDSTLLLSMVAASVVGGWLGAGVVSRLSRRPIQRGMGVALLAAAFFMAMSQLGWFPSGGTALGLPLLALVVAVIVNFVLGALLMLGIGNYGPCLVLLSLLGMDPRAAFPIMMSTGGLVIMVGGLKFMDTGRYDLSAALGLVLGGLPAVLIAGLIVKSLPLGALRWMVVAVVIYAAVEMLRSARAAGVQPPTKAQPAHS